MCGKDVYLFRENHGPQYRLRQPKRKLPGRDRGRGEGLCARFSSWPSRSAHTPVARARLRNCRRPAPCIAFGPRAVSRKRDRILLWNEANRLRWIGIRKKAVQEAIEHSRQNRTTSSSPIAHTLMHSEPLVVEGGEDVGARPHDDLLRRGGRYARSSACNIASRPIQVWRRSSQPSNSFLGFPQPAGTVYDTHSSSSPVRHSQLSVVVNKILSGPPYLCCAARNYLEHIRAMGTELARAAVLVGKNADRGATMAATIHYRS